MREDLSMKTNNSNNNSRNNSHAKYIVISQNSGMNIEDLLEIYGKKPSLINMFQLKHFLAATKYFKNGSSLRSIPYDSNGNLRKNFDGYPLKVTETEIALEKNGSKEYMPLMRFVAKYNVECQHMRGIIRVLPWNSPSKIAAISIYSNEDDDGQFIGYGKIDKKGSAEINTLETQLPPKEKYFKIQKDISGRLLTLRFDGKK
jgi:hypothetical protein